MKLTAKQERFAQAVADGCSQTEAYCYAYNVKPSTAASTVHENASHLATKVAPRIAELQAITQDAIAERRVWDAERLIDEAETNLNLAREFKQIGSANGSVELIGRVTGLLNKDNREQIPVQITRIEIVVPAGSRGDEPRVVEAREIRALPAAGDSND